MLPCFNEEANVEAAVTNVLQWFDGHGYDGEVIAVNDGSVDGTAALLEKLQARHPRVTVCTHATNQGYGRAVRTGLDRAQKAWMGFMDGDRQFRAEDFEKLLPHTADFAFVTGRRHRRADPFIRRINAKLFACLNFLVLGIWVRDTNCAMKLWKRDIWPTIRPQAATGSLFNAEMFYRMKLNNIAWKQTFVEHYPRTAGTQTGANVGVILRMFRDLWLLKTGD